jgi:hypothetical protein
VRADHGPYDASRGDPRGAAVHSWAEQAYFELDPDGPVWVVVETDASSVSATSSMNDAGIAAVPPLLAAGVRVRESLRFEPVAAGAPWTSVVGGGPSGLLKVAAAAAALAAAALAALGGGLVASRLLRRPGNSRPATVGYVLQLDRDHLEVAPEGSAVLLATPWRVLADGSHVPAPEARLHLALPAGARGWVVSPASGSGGLACTVGVHGPQPTPRVLLTVTASAGGSTTAATAIAEVQPGFRLAAGVDGAAAADAQLQAGRWSFPPIDTCFVGDDGQPARPPFRYAVPTISATPDVVEAAAAASPDGVIWTIPVRARPGGGLDALLLANGGAGGDIVVDVHTTDESGRTHRATVTYRVHADLRLRLEPPSVELRLDQGARLEVRLVRATGRAEPEVLPARLTLSPPEGTGVTLAPLQGDGVLTCDLEIDDPERAVSFLLPVAAELPGRPRVEGLASVVVVLPYEVAIVRGPEDARAVGAWTLDPEATLTIPAVVLDTSAEPPCAEPLLAPRIVLALRGPNARLVKLGSPTVAGAQARIDLTFVEPADDQAFEPGDPQIVASLRLGGKSREHAVTLSLSSCRQWVLEKAIRAIAADLAAQGYFVRNRLQGNPVLDAEYQAYSAAWGLFSGHATTCEGYVAASEAPLLAAVRRCYGDEARLEQMTIIEKSTVVGSGLRDWLDACYDDNHTLFRLSLPDGTQHAVDFWENARKLIPDHPVVNRWAGVEAIWRRRLGADFDPAYSVTTHRVIQAGTVRAPAAVRP